MSRVSVTITCAALAIAVTAAREASAQSRCPAIDGGDASLEAQDPVARLEAIRAVMREQASRGRTWTVTWSAIGVGLAAAGWVEYPFVDPDKRLPQAVVSIAPLYIPAALALFPLRVSRDDDALEAYLETTKTSVGSVAPCLRLARAEELLEDAAADEHWHDSVAQHIACIVLSGAYTAFLAVAFHDPRYTFVDGAGALVQGEVQLVTQPNGAVDALERYRRGDLSGARASASSWSVGPLGVAPGVSLVARF